METFYLIDFENVGNRGIANIKELTKDDHVHIFSTENALGIDRDVFWLNGDIKSYLVPASKQSLDKHLVSYLGYLLGIHGKQCAYVIVSDDNGYDKIVEFWKKEGYANISKKPAIPGKARTQQKSTQQPVAQTETLQTVNSKISAGMAYDFSGDDRSELNLFMQHELATMGYSGKDANRICRCVVAHCNDEFVLREIHNDLCASFNNYAEVYEDVKTILEKFVSSKSRNAKKEAKVRSFFGQHFKKKIYVDCKEEIIGIIVNARTRQQVNNGLLKLYSDGTIVKHIYQTVQPLIRELPGK